MLKLQDLTKQELFAELAAVREGAQKIAANCSERGKHKTCPGNCPGLFYCTEVAPHDPNPN